METRPVRFAQIPGCELLALAEVRAGLRDRVADRYGIPRRYKSHEEIARDPEIEAVGVSAGFTLQGQIARDLLRAGKHVFMLRPLLPLLPQFLQIQLLLRWRAPVAAIDHSLPSSVPVTGPGSPGATRGFRGGGPGARPRWLFGQLADLLVWEP